MISQCFLSCRCHCRRIKWRLTPPAKAFHPTNHSQTEKAIKQMPLAYKERTSCTTVDGQKTFCSMLRLLDPSRLWMLIRRIFRLRPCVHFTKCVFVKRVRNFKLCLYFLNRHKSHISHMPSSPKFFTGFIFYLGKLSVESELAYQSLSES